MLDFDEFSENLRKSTNFVNKDNFDEKLDIIKETLNLEKHTMIMNEGFYQLDDFYFDFEKADLIDFWKLERSYGRINQKR